MASDPTSASDTTGQVPAVDRALDILELLALHPAGLGLTEISEALLLPKNAVFRITGVLAGRGYLRRGDADRRFRLTAKFLTLGRVESEPRPLTDVALPAMRALRDATRETVQLGVRSGTEGVIIETLDGLHPLRIVADRGLRFRLHNNAPGKALLAFAPPAERDELLRTLDLPGATARTITDRDALRKECERIVARGYSTDFAEADEGIHCVAAVIHGRHDALVGTLWISGPSRRLTKDAFPEAGRQVKAAADEISRQLQL